MRRVRLVRDGSIVGHVEFRSFSPAGHPDYQGIPDGVLSDPDAQAIAEALVAQPVQQAVEGVQPLVRERGVTLSVSLPPEPVFVDADPTRLQQVVGNLLSNAAKYTDPGVTSC